MKKCSLLFLFAMTLASCAILSSKVQAVSADGFDLFFDTCNSSGTEKHIFQLDENVYVKGGNFFPDREVSVYVIPSGKLIKPENAISGPIIQSIAGHSLPITLVWCAPLSAGTYDVWIDVNQNGKLDFGDRYQNIFCGYQFLVVPEYFIGSIGAVVAMMASLALYSQRRARSPKA